MINKAAYMERGVCSRNYLPNRKGQNKSGNVTYFAGLKKVSRAVDMEVSANTSDLAAPLNDEEKNYTLGPTVRRRKRFAQTVNRPALFFAFPCFLLTSLV